MRVFTDGNFVVHVPTEFREVSSREYPSPADAICVCYKKQIYVFLEPENETVNARNN
jgi:hypothetical protein